MPLIIRKLDTSSRRDVNRFIELPFRIYRDCQQWVPPLVDDVKLMMDRRRYPFYEHSDADFFVAERKTVSSLPASPCWRIAITTNTRRARRPSSTSLMPRMTPRPLWRSSGQIETWARARNLTKIVGAKGFLQGDGVGVLVEGFEHHPAVGIPYNHAYYGELIERAGYTRQRDFMSAYLPGNVELPPRVREIAEKMMARRGFSIRTFASKSELRAWVPAIVQTYNDTFVGNWEFNPITEREGKVIGDRLLQIADPKLIKLVMKGDTIAGFLFGFPDISEGIRRANGRLWPFGWFWLLREFGRTKWINLNGAGILAPYRGLGVNAILYVEMQKTIASGHFEHADIVQIEESVLTLDDARTMGAEVYKKHRIYEKILD